MKTPYFFLTIGILAVALLSGPFAARAQNGTGASPTADSGANAVRLVAPIGHTDVMSSLAVSPDGKFALSGAWDNTGALWEVATGRELRRFGSQKAMRQVGFGGGVGGAPLQALTISYSEATLWDAASGERLQRIVPPIVSGEEYQFTGGAVSPDGTLIAAQVERWKPSPFVRHLRIYSAKTGAELFGGASVLAGVDVDVVVFSPDSKRLLIQPTSFDKKIGTLYVLDTATGERLMSLQSPAGTSFIGVPHFSADGKLVVAPSFPAGTDINKRNDSLLIWSWPDGALLRSLPNQGDVGYLAVSSTGDRAAIAVGHTEDPLKPVLTVSLKDGSQLSRVGFKSSSISGIAYRPGMDGLLVASNEKGQSVGLVDYSGSVIARRFGNPGVRIVSGLAVSARGAVVGLVDATPLDPPDPAAPPTPQFRLWDFRRGAFAGPLLRLDGPNGLNVTPKTSFSISKNAVSADGASVVGRSGDPDAVVTWNSKTGTRQILETAWSTGDPWISPDGTLVGVPHGEVVRLFDTRTGSVVWSKEKPKSGEYSGGIRTGAFSVDNSRLVTGDMWGNLQVWDVTSGTVLRQWIVSSDLRDIRHIVLVPGHKDLAVAVSASGQSALWNLDTGTLVREYSKNNSVLPVELQTAAVSGDGEKIAAGGSDGVIHLWNLATGAPLGLLRGHSSDILGLCWDGGEDGPRLVSTSRDGTTRVWNTTGTGGGKQTVGVVLLAPKLTEASASSLDWVAFRPDGTFEGSAGGTSRVHFARGLQTFAVDQFSEAFLRSGLVAAALPLPGQSVAENIPPPPSRDSIAGAVTQGAPPIVRLTAPPAAPTVEIAVAATEQGGGGVKAIRLYQNGRLVGGPTALRGIAVEAVSGATTTKRFVVSLAPGVNVFRAVAYSKTDLESAPVEATLTYHPAQIARPTLYVLAVGINAYQDATMNLTYARPDAEALAKFFELPGKKAITLFGKVTVSQLVDEKATAAAIAAHLAAVAGAAKPDDVVFIYFAGHGETADGTWYFLPHEMRQMALSERVKQYGIPWSTIEAAVGKITARKIVLVVDACKSGAALEGAVRGGADTEQQALAVMARAQGIHILTAATGQQYAAEVKELGHGILTYALLEGLGGKAGISTESDIYIRGLMSYVEDRVPALSKQYRGSEQYPVPFERGQNFPLVSR